MRNLVITAAVAGLLAACASAPPRSDQVERARSAVQALAQDPLAQRAAPEDLQAARADLDRADTALQQKEPQPVVDHLAYLAQRHAEAGEARVQAARSAEDVARAGEARNQALLAARSRDAEAAKAQLAATQAALAELKARQTDRGIVVTLGDVLFDTARANLKPGANLTLDRLAAYMKENPQSRVLIEGHTDSRGSDAYNDALSQQRADAVQAALIRRGVSPDSIKTVGRGKEYPVASNDTPEGRQQNRRVEIVFSDNTGRFASSDAGEPVAR
jgi:outer membrane protein OmpA-like peptidoglycan-associated protein